MRRAALLFGIAGAVAVLAIWGATLGGDVVQSNDGSAEVETTRGADMVGQMDEAAISRALAARFPDAPPDVTAVAAQIIGGSVPDLSAMDADHLDAVWSRPFPVKQPAYVHTLLREAVISGNAAAARVLIGAGANVHFNSDEMAYLAVQFVVGPIDLAWPDYSIGTALLTIWLDAGGNPNVHNVFYGSLGPLLNTVPRNNLEGMMTLLRAGADPWRVVDIVPTMGTGTFPSTSFVKSLASANPHATEAVFRLSLEGLIGPGPADRVAAVQDRYDLTAENYLGGTGPETQMLVWQLQRAIAQLYPRIGAVPQGHVAALMAMDVPDDAGGFWLAPGQIRSPDTPQHRVTNDNQYGSEHWSDVADAE